MEKKKCEKNKNKERSTKKEEKEKKTNISDGITTGKDLGDIETVDNDFFGFLLDTFDLLEGDSLLDRRQQVGSWVDSRRRLRARGRAQ